MLQENISKIHPLWKDFFETEFKKEYFASLSSRVDEEYKTYSCFPEPSLIFRAFFDSAPSDIKVVILGQDPYHTKGAACGLSFSVPAGFFPPSLRNIAKELEREYGHVCIEKDRGDLSSWSKQGVMLLNSSLSVRESEASSHSKIGWEDFTDSAIKKISEDSSACVFMLWGKHAQNKEGLIDETKHMILKTSHPSPLSANKGFLGCDHFLRANEFLRENGREEISWKINSI